MLKNCNITDKYGNNYLMLLCEKINEYNIGIYECIVKSFIGKINNIDHKNNHGETALMLAKNSRLIQILLEDFGADKNVVDKDGQTAITRAIDNDNFDIFCVLLYYSKKTQNVEHLDLLPFDEFKEKIEIPTNLNLQSKKYGATILMFLAFPCVSCAHKDEVFDLILNNDDVDITIEDIKKRNILMYASSLIEETES